MPNDNLVVEFHYKDGDVGVHPEVIPGKSGTEEIVNWFKNNKGSRRFNLDGSHTPSHVVIRFDTEEGQELSNVLYKMAKDFHASQK